ncbi:MAG TPA: hypothetical protein VMU95_14905 [Trebonia sp.]|nr:hypothetical protein [Trebonia sp.]
MTEDDRGYGPDDMGDDEQEFEAEEYERYIEDPPDGELDISEDDDADADSAQEWADHHPAAAGHDGTPVDETDRAAEEAAVQERRPPR